MVKLAAILFGLLFLTIGIMGFIPDFTPNNKLFNLFMVNFWHNIVHIATGVIALMCGLTSTAASKIFFILFGLIYAAVAVLGFMQGEGMLLGFIAINTPDNWLHVAVAIISLYLGFFLRGNRS